MTAILTLDIAETIDDFKFGAKVKSEKGPALADRYTWIKSAMYQIQQNKCKYWGF